MTLEDTLWDVLDALHLGEFFDEHNIPPIVFPIAVIAVIALIFFLFFMPAGGPPTLQDVCGDGICGANETTASCPDDCPPPQPTTKNIRVSISGAQNCNTFTVSLKDQSGTTIGTKTDQSARVVTFTSVSAKNVYAEVSSAQSQTSAVTSDTISTESKTTIGVVMPNDYCQASITPTQKGSIFVTITDQQTGQDVDATVALFDTDGTPIGGVQYMNGQGTFTDLEPNTYYYLTATAKGYNSYNGQSDPMYVQPGNQANKQIQLVTSMIPAGAKGKLEVCVKGDNQPIESSGELGVYDLEGQLKAVGNLKDCPLFRGEATSKGCYIFTLDAGQQYYTGISRAPSGCTAGSDRLGPILIEENQQKTVFINLTCDFTGSIRARVRGLNNIVLTDSCTVELYYKNGARIRTMEVDSSGNYTEYVEMRDGDKVYIYAKNPPAGYIATKSSTVTITAGENKTVEISLNVPPPPLPNMTIINAALSANVMQRNQTFNVTADAVMLSDTALMPTSGVSVICRPSWAPNTQITANYTNNHWVCLMRTPMALGQKTVTIEATKVKANPASEALTLFVFNTTVQGCLRISLDTRHTATRTSPVSLYFNITQINGTTWKPADNLDDLYVQVDFKGKFIINYTRLQRVVPGLYLAQFAVPFKGGDYHYNAFASMVANNNMCLGFAQGKFRTLAGEPGSITCSVSPQILSPGDSVNMTAAFALNGAPIGNQDLRVTVYGRAEEATTPMVWDVTSERYELETTALRPSSPECAYTVKCWSYDDANVTSNATLYAVNGDATGVDSSNCPVNVYDCSSLSQARACYKFYLEGPIADNYDAAVQCAENGMPACISQQTGQCYQALRLKVRGVSTTKTNTTDFLYYRLTGAPNCASAPLTALPPYTSPLPTGQDVTYQMMDITVPGGSSPGVREQSSFSSNLVTVAINPTTRTLSASACCDVACGTRGDLNNDGLIDGNDIPYMREVMTTISILGQSPSPGGDECFDVNNDGYITSEDLQCLSMVIGGTDPANCPQCAPDSTSWNPDSLEVCSDGRDNNCDGQTDSDTFDRIANSYYSFPGAGPKLEDICSCTSHTPCTMLSSISGMSLNNPTEENVKRCVSINNGPYQWANSLEWQCTTLKTGATLMCGGNTKYVCQQSGGVWEWVMMGRTGETYPQNPLSGTPGGNYHYVCDYDNKLCKAVEGPGRNDCTPSTYWGECEHNVCNYASQTCDAVSGRGENQCDGTYWGFCAHTVCDDYTHTCKVINNPGTDQCSSSSGLPPADVYYNECPWKHYICNNETRTCNLVVDNIYTKGTPSQCDGTYWGNCMFRTCDDNGVCTIVEGQGPDTCASNYDCTWDKSGIWIAYAAAADCPPESAMTKYDCHSSAQDTRGTCNQRYSRAYCMKLPPGATLGPAFLTNPSHTPDCDVEGDSRQGSGNYVAVGFQCASNSCGSGNMQLKCAKLNTAISVGSPATSAPPATGYFNCSSLFPTSIDSHNDAFLTKMECFGTSGAASACSGTKMAITCQLFSPATSSVD